MAFRTIRAQILCKTNKFDFSKDKKRELSVHFESNSNVHKQQKLHLYHW